jgi:PQ loop repeat
VDHKPVASWISQLDPSPQFIEIYRLREVRGVSFLFMAFDIGGGGFSLLSLIFKTQFDGLAAGSYIAVIVSR